MVRQVACCGSEIVLGRARLRVLGGLETRTPKQRAKHERRQLPGRLWRSARPFLPELRLSLERDFESASLGLPDAALFLWLTVACQIAGGLMVLLGFWARLGALALLSFTVIATLLGHGTRGLTGDKRQQQET